MSRFTRIWPRATALALAIGACAAPPAMAVPAAGAQQIATADPDLASARITVASDDTAISRVEACYDQPLARTADGDDFDTDADGSDSEVGTFRLEGYDAGNVRFSTGSRVIAGRTNCVEIDFSLDQNTSDPATPGADVEMYTILVPTAAGELAASYPGAVVDAAGRPGLPGAAALEGTRQTPANGRTSGPDFTGQAVVDVEDDTITYEFDTQLTAVFDGNENGILDEFGYVTAAGIPVYSTTAAPPPDGFGVVRGNLVRVGGFALDNDRSCYTGNCVSDDDEATTLADSVPVRLRVDRLAVIDQEFDWNHEGATGEDTAAAELQSATQVGPDEFELVYDRPVQTLSASTVVVAEDGQKLYAATSFTRPSSDLTVVRARFEDVGAFSNKLVAVADLGGGASDLEDDVPTAEAYVPLRQANIAAGFTDAPDLTAIVPNAGGGTVTFRFDQPVDPSTLAPGSFFLVDGEGNLLKTEAFVSATGADVVMRFARPDIEAAYGATVLDSAICDFEGKVGPDDDCNPAQTVGVQRSATTGTGTGTTTTGTTTTTTTTGGTVQRVRPTSVSIAVRPRRERRRPYRFTITGRVAPPSQLDATQACADLGLVSVQVKIRTRTISTRRVRLRSSCRYTVRVSFASRARTRQIRRAGRLRFRARFLGNRFLLPRESRIVAARTR